MPKQLFFTKQRKPPTINKNIETYCDVDEWHGLDTTASFRKYWRGKNMRGWLFSSTFGA